MQALRTLALAWIGAAALLPAHAQRIAPGLWEMKMNMASPDGKLQQQMAAMQKELAQLPPEQRKMMEEMMARQGVGIDAAKGMHAARICISKEQAERDELPADPDGRCKYERMQRSGSMMRFAFTCSDPQSRGEGEIKLQGDKAYSSRMTTETTGPQGRTERMEINQQARWLSADCGTLKPAPKR
ncbi:MAG: hypothetical protein ABS84_15250 [Rubrivivax sp. SCN 71-131]|jgi:hypothetical protein|nr:MAG: hypothetical protein ABS84_15250 [Rubrivivax sp. SCN 71-131]